MHRATAWFFRFLLLIAATSVFVVANIPAHTFPIGFASDKLNHAAAFAVLTPLFLFAFPSVRLIWLFAGLLGFNALIELSQGFFGVGREPDVGDWLVGAVVTTAITSGFAIDRAIQTSRQASLNR